VDECQPLTVGHVFSEAGFKLADSGRKLLAGRGLHSFTFQLNLSRV